MMTAKDVLKVFAIKRLVERSEMGVVPFSVYSPENWSKEPILIDDRKEPVNKIYPVVLYHENGVITRTFDDIPDEIDIMAKEDENGAFVVVMTDGEDAYIIKNGQIIPCE